MHASQTEQCRSEPDWISKLPQRDFFKHQIFFCRGTKLSQGQAKAAWHIISLQHRERTIRLCDMCLFWSYLFHNCSPGFCLCCQTRATRKQLSKSVSTHHRSHGRSNRRNFLVFPSQVIWKVECPVWSIIPHEFIFIPIHPMSKFTCF